MESRFCKLRTHRGILSDSNCVTGQEHLPEKLMNKLQNLYGISL